MFAPPVKATAPKAAARAATTRNLKEAQHKSDIDHEQETRRARTDHPKAVLRASLDFSKIPIFAPDQPASFQPLRVQPKLTVGAINDPLEQEADRVADQVTRMPDPEPSVASVPAQLGRKCATCEDEDKKLQKKLATPQTAANEAPAIVHEVLRTPGQPLDAATRDYFEPRFGHDFSRVRVHSDAEAAESAREVNARAYTIRNNIVF